MACTANLIGPQSQSTLLIGQSASQGTYSPVSASEIYKGIFGTFITIFYTYHSHKHNVQHLEI